MKKIFYFYIILTAILFSVLVPFPSQFSIALGAEYPSNAIVFDYRAKCSEAGREACSYSTYLDRRDIERCEKEGNSEKCIEDVVENACKPIQDLGDRYYYKNYSGECYSFFAKRLENANLCRLASPPRLITSQVSHCLISLDAKILETVGEEICSEIPLRDVSSSPSLTEGSIYYEDARYYDRDNCYEAKAVKLSIPAICDKIKSEYGVAQCYGKLGIKEKSSSQCDGVEGATRKICIGDFLRRYYLQRKYSKGFGGFGESVSVYGPVSLRDIQQCMNDNPLFKRECILQAPVAKTGSNPLLFSLAVNEVSIATVRDIIGVFVMYFIAIIFLGTLFLGVILLVKKRRRSVSE